MRRRTILVLCALTVLTVAVVFFIGWFGGKRSTQFGSDFTPLTRQTRVVRDEKIALKIWGPVCGGDVVVAVAPLEKKGIIGKAFYVPRVEGRQFSKPFRQCSIVINSRRRFSNVRLCQIVVHEVGHLAGFRDPSNTEDPKHSANPRSIMFAQASNRNVPRLCR